MPKEIHLRLKNDQLYQEIEKYANQNSLSINDAIVELITRGLFGSEIPEIKEIKGGKIIILKFKTKCSKCSKDLNVGDLAYWVKYSYSDGSSNSIVLCLDCYYSLSDKTMASLVLRRYKLKKEINALSKYEKEISNHIEQLEEKLRELNPVKEYIELKTRIESLLSYIEKIFEVRNDLPLYNEIKNTISNILNELRELGEKVKRIER